MEATVQNNAVEDIKPPITQVGVVGWVRTNLFKGWLNSILTLITIYFLWITVPPLIRWAFIDSLWVSTGSECQQIDGACWSIIPANIRFITFGFFPYDQQWRPFVAMGLLVALLFYSRNRHHWKKTFALCLDFGPFSDGLVDEGRIFRPGLCGKLASGAGFHLTLLLSVFGLTAAYPLGVVLALGSPIQNAGGKNTVCHVY